MIKIILIGLLTGYGLAMTLVAYRNSIPLCDNLVEAESKQQLICQLSLGDISEDKANVRMRDEQNVKIN